MSNRELKVGDIVRLKEECVIGGRYGHLEMLPFMFEELKNKNLKIKRFNNSEDGHLNTITSFMSVGFCWHISLEMVELVNDDFISF